MSQPSQVALALQDSPKKKPRVYTPWAKRLPRKPRTKTAASGPQLTPAVPSRVPAASGPRLTATVPSRVRTVSSHERAPPNADGCRPMKRRRKNVPSRPAKAPAAEATAAAAVPREDARGVLQPSCTAASRLAAGRTLALLQSLMQLHLFQGELPGAAAAMRIQGGVFATFRTSTPVFVVGTFMRRGPNL